jgi:hypothetical protein
MEGNAMRLTVAAYLLFLVSISAAQEMDQRNDPPLQLTFYTPHRVTVSKERQGNALLRDEWSVVPT